LNALTRNGSKVRSTGPGQYQAQCPAHADRVPSLSIRQATGGTVLLKCHAGCPTEAVVAALGLDMKVLFAEERDPGLTVVAVYPYRTSRGETVFEVVRYAPKSFRQRRPDGNGDYEWTLKGLTPEQRSLPYKLPQLAAALAKNPERPVYIVEGERDVETLWGLDCLATCNAAGAGKFTRLHADRLVEAGAQRVLVIADRDEPGRAHALNVVKTCRAAGLEVEGGGFLVAACPCPCKDSADMALRHGDNPGEWPLERVPVPASHNTPKSRDKRDSRPVSGPPAGETPPAGQVTTRGHGVTVSRADEPDPFARDLGLLGSMAKAVAACMQVSPGFALAAALGVAAVPVGLAVDVSLGDEWVEPAILHVAVIAAPSERKTPLLRRLMTPLYEKQRALREQRDEEIRRVKARKAQLARQLKQADRDGDPNTAARLAEELEALELPSRFLAVTNRGTPEALEHHAAKQGEGVARLALVTDEGAGTLGDLSRYQQSADPNFDPLVQGYDAVYSSTLRIGRESVTVDGLRIPATLMVQPSVWDGLRGNRTAAGRGVLARFLPVRPESLVGQRFGPGAPIPAATSDAWSERLSTLLEAAYEPGPHVMSLSPGAAAAFRAAADDIERQIGPVRDDETWSGWLGKQAGRVVRIAAVLHAVNTGRLAGQVTEPEMRAAVALGKWLQWHAERELRGSFTFDARRLAEWAERHGHPFTARDAYRSMHWPAQRCEDALEELVAAGSLVEADGVHMLPAPGDTVTCCHPSVTYPEDPVSPGQGQEMEAVSRLSRDFGVLCYAPAEDRAELPATPEEPLEDEDPEDDDEDLDTVELPDGFPYVLTAEILGSPEVRAALRAGYRVTELVEDWAAAHALNCDPDRPRLQYSAASFAELFRGFCAERSQAPASGAGGARPGSDAAEHEQEGAG
jgi:putative DNA primase/helicase